MNKHAITVMDAGMGKALSMRGVDIPGTIWSANALIVAPEIVLDVHRENIDAGASLITTNSYGVIRSDLAKENIEEQFASLNQLAGELAQQAVRESGKEITIAGSLPPLNGSFRPDLVLEPEALLRLYTEQASLLAPFVDLFLCETMSSVVEAKYALLAAREFGKPVLLALTLDDDEACCLRSGEPLDDALEQLCPLQPLGILANCCLPERISDAMPALVSAGLAVAGGYANAFSRVPKDFLLDGAKESDRTLPLREDLSPDFYLRFIKDWIASGATLVGGCCGTTAEHTQVIADFVASRA